MEATRATDAMATYISLIYSRSTQDQTLRDLDRAAHDNRNIAILLDFVVIPLKRKGYDAILRRGWLVQAKVKHDWKRNMLSMESGGRRFTIDLHTQMVEEEAVSSDSEGEEADEGRE
jgi:hypothetical protein